MWWTLSAWSGGSLVEVDGEHHTRHEGQATYDAVRDEAMRGARFRVLRFTNRQVFQELDEVLGAILEGLRVGGWAKG